MLHKRKVTFMLIMPMVIQAIEDEDDRQFMEQLYFEHSRLMYATAWKYSAFRMDVEDVVSDSCVALITKIPALRKMDRKALCAYIISTVRNKTIDANRKASRAGERIRQEDAEVLENMAGGKTMEEQVLLREKLRIILEVASGLPWVEQDVLRMKYQQGMSAREIAEETGMPEEDVWKCLKRARQAIRQAV